MDEKISKHISYSEATRSDVAKRENISNEPNAIQLQCMKNVAEAIFEAVRDHFNVVIYISSFFRSEALNKAVGGASDSQHKLGQAMDIDADMFGKVTNREIFNYIKDNLDFDQLIDECIGANGTDGWVHCSYVSKEKNRKEILVMEIKNGKKYYKVYTT